jgi:hypothetical protein
VRFFAWTWLPQNTPCSQKLFTPGLYGHLVWWILLKNTSVISLNCNRRFRFGKPNYTLSSLLWRRHFTYCRLQRRHWLPTRSLEKKKINFLSRSTEFRKPRVSISRRFHFDWFVNGGDFMRTLWKFNSIEHNPWEHNSRSASQEVPRFLWISKVQYRIHTSLPRARNI